MAQSARRKVVEQVLIQLIEADVDIGFGLVDEARAYRLSGQAEFSVRALQDAAAIVADIERRLREQDESNAWPSLPLLEELRSQILAAGKDA